jgi:UPF0755 protein
MGATTPTGTGLRDGDRAWNGDPWDGLDDVWADDVEAVRPHRRQFGRVLGAAVAIVVVAVLVLAWRELSYVQQLNPPGPPGPAVQFTIGEGESLDAVAARLADEGLVLDETAFVTYVERNGGLEPVPGYYLLRPDDHVGNLLAVLRTPPAQTYTSVVFPEGFTVGQMARRLADRLPGVDAERFRSLATTDSGLRSVYQPDGGTR